MYFETVKAILIRGLSLISRHANNSEDVDHKNAIKHLINKRQQSSDYTSGGQIIYSIPPTGNTYGGVSKFNWTQVQTSFIANSTSVIFSILVRNDPSFFSFDDFSCTTSTNQTNLIANPGFEDGAFTPWFLVGVEGLPYAGYIANNSDSLPHSGNWDFYDGAVGGIDGISQVLTTVPNTNYSVSFWISEQDPVNAGVAALAQSVVSDFRPPTNLHLTPATDSGFNHTDGITNVSEPILTGNASPRIGVNIYLNGTLYGTVNSDQNGTFTFPFPSSLPPGQTTITSSSVVGNLTSSPSTPPFIVTYIPASLPTLTLLPSEETEGDNTSDDILHLEGVGTPNTNITIFDGGVIIGYATASTNGAYTFTTLAQSDGFHNYTAQEPMDEAGNIGVSRPLGVVIVAPENSCAAEL